MPGKPLRPARLPNDPEQKDYVLDMIMMNTSWLEPLPMSLSRLALAAAYLGYDRLQPTAVWHAYRHFPHLSQLKNQRTK